jgi:perosamine synthetase
MLCAKENPDMIAVNSPLFEGRELEYLQKCIETGWISSEGPFVAEFEDKFSSYVDREHGIAVSNGSAALDIAVAALGIGEGDEVIMPAFTIISPAQSVVRAGGVPVLVDSDPYTWNMDVRQVESKITKKTKAILVVHIYGLPVDMNPILDLAKEHNLLIIEDAAEMHGQTYKGRMCGSFGDISVFSFYANKLITTGEGGMILTDKPLLAEKCRSLRNLAFGQGRERFIHEDLGWNYRMTNLQAGLGLAQLEQIDKHIAKKKSVAKKYSDSFADVKGFQLPLHKTDYAENIYWVFGMVAETETLANETVSYLHNEAVATRPFFWPMHEQPVFKKMGLFLHDSHPVAESLARRGFYLPCGLALNDEEQNEVILTIMALAKPQ